MKRVVLCDFDGTITGADVTDTLCRRFASQHRDELRRQSQRWERGEISAVEWSEVAYRLMDLRQDQIDAVLEETPISLGTDLLLDAAQERGWEFHILSSGFDYYIRRILARLGRSVPFTANRLSFTSEGGVQLGFLDDHEPGCTLYKPPCIGCKPVGWRTWKRRGYRISFVGDGVSDYCLAERWDDLSEPGDVLFAKDKLERFCRRRKVAYVPYETLADVAEYLVELE